MKESINPRVHLDNMMEHLDKNADKSIDDQERQALDGEFKREALYLKAILDGNDDLRKQALTMAVIMVSSEYNGVNAMDVLQMLQQAVALSDVDDDPEVNRKANSAELADDLSASGKDKDFRYSVDVDVAQVWPMVKTTESRVSVPDSRRLVDNINEFSAGLERSDIAIFEAYNDFLDGNLAKIRGQGFDIKSNLILLIGNKGVAGYSKARMDDVWSGDAVSMVEFWGNLKERRKFEKKVNAFRHETASWQGNSRKKDHDVSKFMKEASDEFGIEEDELKKMWEESDGSFKGFQMAVEKKHFQLGVCRDIAALQAFAAYDIGMKDAFTTSLSTSGGAHVVAGARNEMGNIVFFDYDVAIPTDTPSMKVALKTLELHEKSVALVYAQGMGGSGGSGLVPVHSKASVILEEVATGKRGGQSAEVREALESNALSENKSGLEFQVEKERTNLQLTVPFLAGTTFVSATYHRTEEDAANSMSAAYSARMAQEWGGDSVRAGAGTAFSHILLKTYENTGDRTRLNELLFNLYAKTHVGFETDAFRYQLMAMVDLMGHFSMNEATFSSAQAKMATGQRFSLFTSDLEVYLDLNTEHSLVPETIQRASLNPQSFRFASDLLAVNLGLDIGVGKVSGHRVKLKTEAQVGGKYFDASKGSFAAKEYKGHIGLNAEKGRTSNVGLDVEAGYVDSGDFRIEEELKGKVSANYGMGVGKEGYLEFKIFGFQNKSLDQFSDDRLDDLGMGFEGVFTF